jgi:hypothetical protein
MLRRLFGGGTDEDARALTPVPLVGGFDVEVVGESNYQESLERICGGRSADGASHDCTAVLRPEPQNPYDPHAIRVEIDGLLVGYLARPAAKAYGPVAGRLSRQGQIGTCTARIVGGWERGDEYADRGHFGVRLDLGVN